MCLPLTAACGRPVAAEHLIIALRLAVAQLRRVLRAQDVTPDAEVPLGKRPDRALDAKRAHGIMPGLIVAKRADWSCRALVPLLWWLGLQQGRQSRGTVGTDGFRRDAVRIAPAGGQMLSP